MFKRLADEILKEVLQTAPAVLTWHQMRTCQNCKEAIFGTLYCPFY